MNKRIIIIDGNSLINRAYYALAKNPMITSTGIYTHAIYGLLNMINKLDEDYEPGYMAVAWDVKAPTFRHKEYKDYKAGRKKMPPELAMEIPLMKEILAALKIGSLEIEGFEADDIIGTVSRESEEAGFDTMIVTGDKDALQLAGEKTTVMFTKRGVTKFDLYDYDKMIEVYGMTPTQFIDLKGLMGDNSDNLPGVPGIGEKTGKKLIDQFGSVAGVIEHADEIKAKGVRTKIQENGHLAVMTRKMAEINRYVPIEFKLEDFKREEPDYEKLIELYRKLEFTSFLKKLDIEGADLKGENIFEKIPDVKEIKSEEELSLLDEIEDGSEVIITMDSDFSHTQIPSAEKIAVFSGEKGYIVKGKRVPENLFDVVDADGSEKLVKAFVNKLDEKNLVYSGHHLKDIFYVLMILGMKNTCTGYDTETAAYVLDPAKSDYSLKAQILDRFMTEIPEDDKNHAYRAKAISELIKVQKKTAEREGGEEVLSEIELPLIKVLASMEKEGIKTDRQVLESIGKQLSEEIAKVTSEIHNIAGVEFNINSPKQLAEVLFEKMELTPGKKTKTGYSTSADVLEKIKGESPIIEKVLYYRNISKLNSTYVEGLQPLIGYDGRIRAHFRQTVAETGRISCTQPNLQNIPVRDEYGRLIRKAFVPSEGNIFVAADYSQIELRVLAHLSGDENLINAFNSGADIHRNTASRVFGIPYDQVTPAERSSAKAVNFGVIYGMSSFGLSEELHISRKKAQNYIDDYFEKHPAVKEYMDGQIKKAKEKGYTETICGRKRYIPEVSASNFRVRTFGERLAMNSPIQGSAADIIKIAMVNTDKALREKNMKSKLILQVHDELIIDTAEDELEEVKKLLTEKMENAIELKVKMIVEPESGKNWYKL